MATFDQAYWRIAAVAVMAFHLTTNTAMATEKTLFDFTTATNVQGWYVVNDDVMGGVSTSTFAGTNGMAAFRGDLSLENNGGFASARSSPARQDLAGLKAFVLRVRGDGRRYKFTVRTESGFDTPIYQCAFTTQRGKWEEHRLAFTDFVPTFRGRAVAGAPAMDPTKGSSVGFLISDKQEGPFQLEVAWIKVTSDAGKRPGTASSPES